MVIENLYWTKFEDKTIKYHQHVFKFCDFNPQHCFLGGGELQWDFPLALKRSPVPGDHSKGQCPAVASNELEVQPCPPSSPRPSFWAGEEPCPPQPQCRG